MKLNLDAKTNEERKVKAYLEANASEMLAEKINNGVRIQKDGKTLLNRKTLAGFMKFACDEAKKQAEKDAQSACIDDAVVYGWAVHYFEEDSIEGTLYNEDGTEYKKQPSVATKAPAVKYTPPKPQPKPQMSMFDLLDAKPEEPDEDEPTDEEIREAAEQIAAEEYDEDDEYVDYKQCEKFSWGYINYKVNQKTKMFIFKGTYSEFYIVRNGDIIIDNSITISKKDLYSVQVRKAGLLSSGFIKINSEYIWCGRRRKDDVKDFCEIMKQNGISVEYEDYWD